MSLETKLLLTLEGSNKPVFTTEDAKEILQTGDVSVWHVLNRLVRKNRLRRIERGRYLLIPARAGVEGHWTEPAWWIVPSLIDPYYVGFWTAMNYWDMTEQIPYTIFVATTKRKRNLEFDCARYEFVTLSEKKFFGFVKEKAGEGKHFNISSREKTIVDGLAHPEYCGGLGEVTKAMWNARKEVDWHDVLGVAERTGINVVVKRLGYLLSVIDTEESIPNGILGAITQKIRKMEKAPRQYLDPTRSTDRIKVSKEYGLAVNSTNQDLLEWMES